jgi:hypothetical protein
MLAFANSLRVVPPSPGRAMANRSSLRSYGPSRGRNRLPGGQDVFGCVFVPVMFGQTFGTLPAPHIQRQRFYYEPAATAPLRRGKKPVNLDEGSSVPLSFVGKLAGDFMPAAIANRFGKATVGHHVAHRQILKIDRLVLANDPGGCFVREIFSGIVNLRVKLGDLMLRLESIGRAFLLFCKPALQESQAGLVFSRIARVADPRSIREGHRAVDPQVDTDAGCRCGQRVDRFIQTQGNKVAARWVPAQRHSRRARGKVPAPFNLELSQFGDSQDPVTRIPLKPGAGILGRLFAVFTLEDGVLRALFEELHKSALQMAKRLLNRNTGHLVQPFGFLGFLQLGKRRAGLAIGDALARVPCVGSQPKRPVVDVAYAPKCPGQDLLLFGCWVKAKTVAATHLSHTNILVCKINLKPFNGAPSTPEGVGFLPRLS